MTTKQIAEAVGKAERSVQRWAQATGVKVASIGVKLASVSKMGKPADYDLDETVAIIETGLGKNAAALYRENAKCDPSREDRLDRLEKMVLDLTKAVSGLIPALSIAKAPALSAPAPLSTRDELRRIMVAAGNASGDYAGAWGQLYQEIYYRLHRNVKECAKNRGISALDYIEDEGMLPAVVAIAREVFGGAA